MFSGVELPSVRIRTRSGLLHRIGIGARLGEREGPEVDLLRAGIGKDGGSRTRVVRLFGGIILWLDGEIERLGTKPTPHDGLINHRTIIRDRRRRVLVIEPHRSFRVYGRRCGNVDIASVVPRGRRDFKRTRRGIRSHNDAEDMRRSTIDCPVGRWVGLGERVLVGASMGEGH